MLRTLHTIGEFDHGHKRRWPLTPHTRELGQGAQAGLGIKATNIHTHRIEHQPHRDIKNLYVIWIINIENKNNPQQKSWISTSGLQAFRPQLVDYWLLCQRHWPLPKSTDILTYSPSCSVRAICQTSDMKNTAYCLAAGRAARRHDVSNPYLSRWATFLLLFHMKFLKLGGE